jgi:rhodanese-related sulfurtransferase
MSLLIKEIEPQEVKKMHDAGELVLIDVREPLEYNEEHLAKAQLFPISHLKPDQLPDPAGKKLLFYCHLGRRSAVAAAKWAECTGESEVYSLKGGISAWKKAGLPVVADSDISGKIERQTYTLSGILVLLGLVLAVYLSDWFLLMPAFVGVLLVISGIGGHSLFSFLLSMLPWNR